MMAVGGVGDLNQCMDASCNVGDLKGVGKENAQVASHDLNKVYSLECSKKLSGKVFDINSSKVEGIDMQSHLIKQGNYHRYAMDRMAKLNKSNEVNKEPKTT